MSAAIATGPDALFKDDLRYQVVARTYEPGMLVFVVAFVFVLTATTQAATVLVPDWFVEGAFASGLVWTLAVLHIPVLLWTRKACQARDPDKFSVAYTVQSLVQVVWLQLLCWGTTNPIGLVMVAIYLAWLFNDAWHFYDAPRIQLGYLAATVLATVVLVTLDFIGGFGFLTLFVEQPDVAATYVTIQWSLTVFGLVVLRLVGRQARAHDADQDALSQAQQELGELRREREVVKRCAGLIESGMTASQFAHDTANNIQVIWGSLESLQAMVSTIKPGATVSAAALTKFRSISADAVREGERLADMSRQLVRSVRDGESLNPLRINRLLTSANREAESEVKGRGGDWSEPFFTLEPGWVHVTTNHIAAVANLIANGTLHGLASGLEISGQPAGAWFYHLEIRDFGVMGPSRDAALERIRATLGMFRREQVSGSEMNAAHRSNLSGGPSGLKLALPLAKLLMVRYNGGLEMCQPKVGPGLSAHLLFPSVAPHQIPEAENRPERVLREIVNRLSAPPAGTHRGGG